VALTAEAFARMFKALLPPGKLWRHDSDSVLSKVLLASADELERVDQRARDLIEESDPRTATELLPDYERELGLVAEGTVEQRRARVVALLLRRQRFRPVDFQQVLAPLLGQAAGDVVVIERGRAFAVLVGDDREIYRFFVYRDPDAPGDYDLEAAQDLIDKMKPTHTAGYAIESVNFLCEDEHSLCDRDLIGA
jgi:hypothetical protein